MRPEYDWPRNWWYVAPPTGTHTYTHKPAAEGIRAVPQQKKQRWMDSLPDRDTDGWTTHGYRHSALQWLSEALYWTEVGEQPNIVDRALSHAGATVVAWRKSLDDQGVKRDDIATLSNSPTEVWLASCIATLAYGGIGHDKLRWVEAVLRSIWRDGQR